MNDGTKTKEQQLQKLCSHSEVVFPKAPKMLNHHIHSWRRDSQITLCWTHLLPLNQMKLHNTIKIHFSCFQHKKVKENLHLNCHKSKCSSESRVSHCHQLFF